MLRPDRIPVQCVAISVPEYVKSGVGSRSYTGTDLQHGYYVYDIVTTNSNVIVSYNRSRLGV